jgi:hypothetical protein
MTRPTIRLGRDEFGAVLGAMESLLIEILRLQGDPPVTSNAGTQCARREAGLRAATAAADRVDRSLTV